jgi:hypothetical protein
MLTVLVGRARATVAVAAGAALNTYDVKVLVAVLYDCVAGKEAFNVTVVITVAVVTKVDAAFCMVCVSNGHSDAYVAGSGIGSTKDDGDDDHKCDDPKKGN